MGVFYNSICLRGRRRREIAGCLSRWLAARGFAAVDELALFDLDGATERSAFILEGPRWTVVVFSHEREERRLIHELGALEGSLLYLWVFDSDVWGYDVFEKGGFAASFSSSPRLRWSFGDEVAGRPRADPAAVARSLGEAGAAAAIRRLHSRRGVAPEEVCRSFCSLFGIAEALSGYDDLEAGTATLPEGWSVRQLLFARRVERTHQADVHTYPLANSQEQLCSGRGGVEIPAELLREMARRRRRMRLVLAVSHAVARMTGSWRAGRRRRGIRPVSVGTSPDGHRMPYRVEGRALVNDRHGCRVQLAAGVEPAAAPTKPSSVFAFRAGQTLVSCTARPHDKIDEVLRSPAWASVLEDRNRCLGELKARCLRFELPPRAVAGTTESTVLSLEVIQASRALYLFLYRQIGGRDPAIEGLVRRTIDTFRV